MICASTHMTKLDMTLVLQEQIVQFDEKNCKYGFPGLKVGRHLVKPLKCSVFREEISHPSLKGSVPRFTE